MSLTAPAFVGERPARIRRKVSWFHKRSLLPGAILAVGMAAWTAFTSFVPTFSKSIGLSGSAQFFALYSMLCLFLRLFGAKTPERIGLHRSVVMAMSFLLCGVTSVAVLGNESPRASVPGEIVPSHEFYDYDDKYVGDGAQLLVPAPLSAAEISEVQQLAIKIYRTLRSDGMARVDFFYEEGKRGFLCNEINTIPGFTPISMYPKLWQASGVSYPELIDELISLALARHAKRRNKTSR